MILYLSRKFIILFFNSLFKANFFHKIVVYCDSYKFAYYVFFVVLYFDIVHAWDFLMFDSLIYSIFFHFTDICQIKMYSIMIRNDFFQILKTSKFVKTDKIKKHV